MAGEVIVGDCVSAHEPWASGRGGARLHRLGQTEVQYLDGAVAAHLDVGGLQIAVDDALLVCRFERLDELSGDGQRFFDRHRPLCQAIRERRPLDELHHQRLHAV
jgi:hypothetical protein